MDTWAAVSFDGGGVAAIRDIRTVTAVRVARRADRCGGGCGLSAKKNVVKILLRSVPLVSVFSP